MTSTAQCPSVEDLIALHSHRTGFIDLSPSTL